MAASAAPPKKRDWSLRSRAVRGVLYQLIALALISLGVWFLASNTLENMRVRGIQSGFDFLLQPAGFDIGETPVAYDALDPYWRAFLIGLLNTLRVAVIGIVLTTIIGTLLGIGRFSHNALVRGLCYGYVELFRNVPILLQLLMWYLLLTEALPLPGEARSVFGLFFLSNGGLSYPVPVWGPAQALAGAGMLAGVVLAWLWARRARTLFEQTGKPRPVMLPALGLVIAGAVVGWVVGGAPTDWSIPKPGGFSVDGGSSLTPEFLAVLLGADAVHRLLRGRGGARRHCLGPAWAGRGGRGAGTVQGPADAAGGAAAGAARDHPADDQPVPQPDQELVARGGHRLPRRGVDLQHRDQPDRPRGGVHRRHHVDLPEHVAGHLGADELVQQTRGDQGTVT